jgi:energy-converting hydrogenase Eha subunit H
VKTFNSGLAAQNRRIIGSKMIAPFWAIAANLFQLPASPQATADSWS